MNHTNADDLRGPSVLISGVDTDSDDEFEDASALDGLRPMVSNLHAVLEAATLSDLPAALEAASFTAPSAPTDSPAPAPTMCSHGSTLRVSTASTYGDDVHASIGCDVPFALSAIPPTGDGDLRAALEAVSLFASNILASQTSGDLRAALASVSSFTSTVLAHHLQPSADSSIESGPALSAPHSTSQPPASTATDAPSLVDTAAATAAPVLCFHDPTTLASSSCPSSDYSVSAYQPFELPSEFGQSALAHCPFHTGPLLLCSSAVSSDISCHPTMNLCPSLAFLPWPPFAPPWDYSFVFPLAPAPPWCFSSWFSPGPWSPLDTVLPVIGLFSVLLLFLSDCLMCCHHCPSVWTLSVASALPLLLSEYFLCCHHCPSVWTLGSAYTLHDRSLLPPCLHFVFPKSIPCGGACSIAPVLCLQHILPAPVYYGACSLAPILCFLLALHGHAHPDILQPATLVPLAILWQSSPSRVSVPSALQPATPVQVAQPSRVSTFASLQPLTSAKLVIDLPPSWPHLRPCPTFDLDSMLRVALALLLLVFSHWKWLPASSSLHPAPASSFHPCLPSLLATLWSQREHLLVAPPWPSTAGLVLQREHVPTVAPPWLSPLRFIPPKEHSSSFSPYLPLTQLLFQREHSLLPPLLLFLGPVSAHWQELSFGFILSSLRECSRQPSLSALLLQEPPCFWPFDDPLFSGITYPMLLATAVNDSLCPHDISASLVYPPLAIVAPCVPMPFWPALLLFLAFASLQACYSRTFSYHATVLPSFTTFLFLLPCHLSTSYVTSYIIRLKQKQQYTQSHPVAVTAMVPTNNIESQTPKTIKTLGRNATGLICPHCQRQTVTVVEDYVGVGTVLAVIVLAILFWPICWLPLCVPTCKRTHHYCGQQTCQRKVGETRVCA
ncbi:LITAF-like zinc ribbon domain containing protein [Nitzschia inconspicua]|uniref:LITAF-like zinc ribbon domain containing protein n=1 Tax=Nitzschia inconspicua TaxID=303405 RepID=A0A9K3LVF2_9STRA|nr:LITAF-like zinc ribbon domain containing protein [Nitzschia inconspicua]